MTDQDKSNTQDIVDYLFHHPEFFHDHLDLLEKMNIPHPSGTATSLIIKQLEMARTKYEDLKTELAALIEIATDNDIASNRMHELTLTLVESESIDDVVEKTDKVFSNYFLTDFSSIRIFKDNADTLNHAIFVSNNNKNLALFKKLFDKNQSICGKPNLEQAQFLFEKNAVLEIKSCAMIPLSFSGLQGVVAIGSKDKTRFHYSMGNLFLTQISQSIGARLHTIINH